MSATLALEDDTADRMEAAAREVLRVYERLYRLVPDEPDLGANLARTCGLRRLHAWLEVVRDAHATVRVRGLAEVVEQAERIRDPDAAYEELERFPARVLACTWTGDVAPDDPAAENDPAAE